ncbi:MAG: InlB B-repeat-containing protein [Clostridia bacterium]|nr:InlB B-repeat-containing protein [Clostridia bacterium]
MKKYIAWLLMILLLAALSPAALAVDNSQEYFFELSIDGSDRKEAMPGDILTVVFELHRTDSDEPYTMHAMQNEIRYDSEFFRMVEGSTILSRGVTSSDIGLRDSHREFYMNYVSLSGGEEWAAEKLVGSFQLEVIGESGTSRITNQDYKVSTPDGKDRYQSSVQDVTVIISSECTLRFETNGGTEIPPRTVHYGETLERPAEPEREGYRLVGWYKDIDLQTPWDFDTDKVSGNMTLYARWEKIDIFAVSGEEEGGSGLWWLIGVALLLGVGVFFLIFFMKNRKTVTFVTDRRTKIPAQKVRKGGFVERPAEPRSAGQIFAGWYSDELRLTRWDFEEDKVEDDMTLYAKWI